MTQMAQRQDARHPLEGIRNGSATLEDFVDQTMLSELLAATRWRIVREFVNEQPLSGYVQGLDGELASVTRHVYATMPERARRKIFSASGLHSRFRSLPSASKETIAEFVRGELFARTITSMWGAYELWYIGDMWSMPQSVLDEYLCKFPPSTPHYRDDRHFHGRPGRDRVRLKGLRLAPGVSIAMS